MKEYLKMSDVFDGAVVSNHDGDFNGWVVVETSLGLSIDESGDGGFEEKTADYVTHAINSHDELVSKLDVAESTIYEVERVLSEIQRNGAFGLDDVIAEVECCIKRLSQ